MHSKNTWRFRLRNRLFSKIFTLSFVGLIVSSCSIPFFEYLKNLIETVMFVSKHYFFYQFQINIILYFLNYFLNQLVPYIIIFWILIESTINPGLFQLKSTKSFKNFILSKVFKKKVTFFNLSVDDTKNEILESKEEKDLFSSSKIEENIIYDKKTLLKENFGGYQGKNAQLISNSPKIRFLSLRQPETPLRSSLMNFSNYFGSFFSLIFFKSNSWGRICL